jgi:hypothetical protein
LEKPINVRGFLGKFPSDDIFQFFDNIGTEQDLMICTQKPFELVHVFVGEDEHGDEEIRVKHYPHISFPNGLAWCYSTVGRHIEISQCMV